MATKYIEYLNEALKPKKRTTFTAVDLFAGCGGLSLGFEANGFATVGYEMNEDASKTYEANLRGTCFTEILTTDTKLPKADILIGGPPCQPFSVNGNQLGLKDLRNGFPICIAAVKKIKPKLFLFENVRGLLYKNKAYLDFIISELQALNYKVEVKLLNAKHFEVPQNRERVFIVGYKKGTFDFPSEKDFLITAGDALGNLPFETPKGSKYVTRRMSEYIKRYERASKCITPRDLHLDRPSRTLTCRNLAGSTGDMHRVKLPSGRKRRLLAEEASRLQSFPQWYQFIGNETSVFNQIGNSVPPMMSYYIAKAIKKHLTENYS